MFSFPLFERLKAQALEFDEVAAFQAGGARLSVRREGTGLAGVYKISVDSGAGCLGPWFKDASIFLKNKPLP